MSFTPLHQVLFVDSRVQNIDQLLAAVDPAIEVIRIDAHADGLSVMASALMGREDLSAVHVISHGAPGSLLLGNSLIDQAALTTHAQELSAIRGALGEGADLQLYGCNVAAGDAGEGFLAAIRDALGVDVAASTDLTGARWLGGNWTLEFSLGAIDSPTLQLPAWQGDLAAPSISGLDPATYTEGNAATIIDSSVTFSGGSAYGGGYVQYSLSSSNSSDQLTLTPGNGITISGSSVYSNGTFIGTIDSTYNGANGQPLRINFQANFTNPSFESGGGGVTGWTIGTSRVMLGSTVINGHTTPSDNTDPPNAGGDADAATVNYNYELSSTEYTQGTNSLRLYNSGNTSNGFDVVHGPYAYSNTFTAAAGDVLYFDWQAKAGGDAFDAFGYLMKADGSQHVVVLNMTGPDDTGVQPWTTASVAVPSSGDWYFVFVAGTYDFTGGMAVGGSLYIDNFKVFGNTVTDSVAQTLGAQVAYRSTADDSPSSARTLTVTAVDGNGASSSATTTLTVTGVNDAPAFGSGGSLGAVNEDTAAPSGATVTALLGGAFSDPDNTYSPTDSLAGIAISGDASTASQGVWQYSTDGSTWFDLGSVSSSSALLLAPTAKLRFVPAADWNGTPGSLAVHPVDSTFGGSFTSGASRQTFDTSGAGGSSAVGASSVSVSTSIASVNDAPVFTSSAVSLSVADTSATDSYSALTGTITGSDSHGGAPNEGGTLTFGVSGGSVGGGSSTLAGTYGTLSINTSTGAYSFTPDATAINALGNGSNPTQSFTVTLTDGQTGSTTQTFTVNLTGANDAPVANNDTGSATEAGGVHNAIAGSPATGSVLTGAGADTDVDTGDTRSVASVRTGGVEGSGTAAGAASGGVFTLAGAYGTLSLNQNGSYTYTVNETHASVEALMPADTLVDTFNYTVADANGLTDIATLAVTIHGADDSPVIAGIPASYQAVEDVPATLRLGMSVIDLDGGANAFVLKLRAGLGTLTATANGYPVTVSGSGTTTLVVSGTLSEVNNWVTNTDVTFLGGLNINGSPGDFITFLYSNSLGGVYATAGVAGVNLTPVNDPPTGGVRVTGTLMQGMTLSVENTIVDPDVPGPFTYTWFANGVPFASGPSSVVLGQDQVDKSITVRASYHDRDGSDEMVTSGAAGPVLNVNDLPTGTVAIKGTVKQGETLQATHDLVDPDGLGTLHWQWYADGVLLTGETGTTLLLAQSHVGKQITVKVSYVDGYGASEGAASGPVGPVANTNDAPTGSVVITGSPTEGQTLVASHSLADPDGLGALHYQWYANGQPVVDAINSTFKLGPLEVGKVITCVISYVDGGGTPEAVTSAGTAAVGNVNDAPVGVLAITGAPLQGETLVAVGTLFDQDGVGQVSYQWYADGQPIDGATGGTLKLTQGQVGKHITVVGRYTDGGGAAESVGSAPTAAVANLDDAPTGTVIITGTATAGMTLNASNNVGDIDGLGPISYQWTVNGVPVDGVSGASLLLTEAMVGKTIAVAALYTDGFGHAERVVSAGSAPVSPSATVDGVQVITGTQTTGGQTVVTQTIAPVPAGRADDPSTPNRSLADIPLASDANGAPLLTVSLPEGVGLHAAASQGSSLGLRAQLIAASQPREDSAAAFDALLQQGIDRYVPTVSDEQQVTVRTITFDAAAGMTTPAGSPIVITGAMGTGESDPLHPLRQEALVIDARHLPPGTVLQFDKVEFAIVIGPAHLNGGAGRNFVIGDGANQFIVLGAEDDLLRGGAGDDTIGSKGGDDQLYGDEGNDLVVGGIGNDQLDGGDGNDVLQGGQSDAGTWRVMIDKAGVLHSSFTSALPELSDNASFTHAGRWYVSPNGQFDTDDRSAYSFQSPVHLELVARLYAAVTGQLPSLGELNQYATLPISDASLSQMAYQYFVGSHAGFSTWSLERQVKAVIEQVWGAGPTSDALVAEGVRYIGQGGSWVDGLLYLARALPGAARLLDADGNLQLIRAYTSGELGWGGASGNDTLRGGDGNDRLVGGDGNDWLDGGAGTDMAVFTGRLADYTLHRHATATGLELVLTKAVTGEVDTLVDVEMLQVGSHVYAIAAAATTLQDGVDYPLSALVAEITGSQAELIGLPGPWGG